MMSTQAARTILRKQQQETVRLLSTSNQECFSFYSSRGANRATTTTSSRECFSFYPSRGQQQVKAATVSRPVAQPFAPSINSDLVARSFLSSVLSRQSFQQQQMRLFSSSRECFSFYPTRRQRITTTPAAPAKECFSFYPSVGKTIEAKEAIKANVEVASIRTFDQQRPRVWAPEQSDEFKYYDVLMGLVRRQQQKVAQL